MNHMIPLFRHLKYIALLLAAALGRCDVAAAEFLPETLIQLEPGVLSGTVRVNRANQVATLYSISPIGFDRDRLAYFTANSSQHYDVSSARLVDLSMSRWGVAAIDFEGPGLAIWAAPFGEPLVEVFRSSENGGTSRPAINDAGAIAFFARESGEQSYRDVYLVPPGETPHLLPDVFEDQLYEPPMIDGQNRVIARKGFSVPQFNLQMYRYDEQSQWVDLTSGRLPEDVVIEASTGLQGEANVSRDGDFVFPTVRLTPDGERYEVMMYDESADQLITVFDRTEQIPGWEGPPAPMLTRAEFADDGSLWLLGTAFRLDFGADVRSIIRRPDGSVLDVGQLLPEGLSLSWSASAHAMNFQGDLWIAADDDQQLKSYFLYHDGRLMPLLEATEDVYTNTVLTDDLQLYYWHEQANGTTFHRVQLVPEPNTWLLMAGVVFPLLWSRIRASTSECWN
jgi:hypothetical protein